MVVVYRQNWVSLFNLFDLLTQARVLADSYREAYVVLSAGGNDPL